MKTITLDYCVYTRKTFKIPESGKFQKYFSALAKSDSEKTDDDWNTLYEYEMQNDYNILEDFIKSQTGETAENVEIWDYE